MRLNVDLEMNYQLVRDETVFLAIEAASTDGQRIETETLEVDNATLHRPGAVGLIGNRLWVLDTGENFTLRYRANVAVTRPKIRVQDLVATSLHDLPGDVLEFLQPSRFCQSDLLTTFAEQHFGHLAGGAKIAAMRDWVAAEIAYVPGSSTGTTTAIDTFVARAGVCRDYTHLLCSFARAANIPARYTSAYGLHVQPQDFHAVAEVWLQGAWHLLDATGMGSVSDLAVIASGRDACDVAFMETNGWAQLIRQNVRVTGL